MRDKLKKTSGLNAALAYSNDLDLFSGEAVPGTPEMLGNIPQTNPDIGRPGGSAVARAAAAALPVLFSLSVTL